MFPNSQDALPLPARPRVDQYKKRAKALFKAVKSPDPTALKPGAREWIKPLVCLAHLPTAAQLPASIDRWVDDLEAFVGRQRQSEKTLSLTHAQFVLARAHGFESWPKFATYLEALARSHSPESDFESAVEAIVSGDVAALSRLLRSNPKLIEVRSN